MPSLLLIRHRQTIGNQPDMPLSAAGAEAAHAPDARLRELAAAASHRNLTATVLRSVDPASGFEQMLGGPPRAVYPSRLREPVGLDRAGTVRPPSP